MLYLDRPDLVSISAEGPRHAGYPTLTRRLALPNATTIEKKTEQWRCLTEVLANVRHGPLGDIQKYALAPGAGSPCSGTCRAPAATYTMFSAFSTRTRVTPWFD